MNHYLVTATYKNLKSDSQVQEILGINLKFKLNDRTNIAQYCYNFLGFIIVVTNDCQ